MRNPLNGTVGHLQLARHALAAAAGEGAAAADALSEVDASLACTETALQFLTTLSRLHSAVTGGMSPQPRPCDVSRVLATVANVVRPQLQPGVELRLDVPTEQKHGVTDPVMLTQILINLLQNAARFTQHGYVCLQCVEEPPHASSPSDAGQVTQMTFTVKDTGAGLSCEARDTLFVSRSEPPTTDWQMDVQPATHAFGPRVRVTGALQDAGRARARALSQPPARTAPRVRGGCTVAVG